MCGKNFSHRHRFSFSFLALCALFLVSPCVPGWTQANSVTYAQKLSQLQAITLKAKNLSLAITLKLTDSKSQIETLQTGLQKTQDELSQFKADLEAQSVKLTLSDQELTTLKSTALDLQDSLTKSEADFQTYKASAESKILTLETEKLVYGLAGVGLGAAILEGCHLMGWVK